MRNYPKNNVTPCNTFGYVKQPACPAAPVYGKIREFTDVSSPFSVLHSNLTCGKQKSCGTKTTRKCTNILSETPAKSLKTRRKSLVRKGWNLKMASNPVTRNEYISPDSLLFASRGSRLYLQMASLERRQNPAGFERESSRIADS